jgi:predicted negative regulator of RcsB-dependent stress response
MAKRQRPKPQPATQAEPAKDAAEKLIGWIQRHQRRSIGGVAAVVAVAAVAIFVVAYQRNREVAAGTSLEQARFATQSGNLPLAASDLSRLIGSFRGTRAADEAVILLGQVRLLQEQPDLAASELREALDRGLEEQFQAPAYSLLGSALENLGSNVPAGEAYMNAANTTWYGLLSAQYLNDAGRAFWAAGDTARAVAAYERVLDEFLDAPSAAEARVRLAELRAGQVDSIG